MKVKNIKGTKNVPFIKVVLITICAIALLPITLILLSPAIKLAKYCRAKEYTPAKLPKEYHDRVKLIAHRGYRAKAIENTLPAYDLAGKANYWGAENDIHRTKDGVWVLHHDYYTYRMMNKNYHIEKTNFDDLCKAVYDNGSFYKDYPDLHITTLEEYLQKCNEYNMKAIIELKGKSNTEHYKEIIDLVEKYNVDATYISFQKNAVETMRRVSDSPVFYIVYKVTDEAIAFAKSIPNCGIDFDGNDDDNKSQRVVDSIVNAGLTPAIWAVDDLDLVLNYADWGVELITTNSVHY